jgi:SAM-dependent methyltransferase
MKRLDRLLQRWRIAMAAPYIPLGARVLDVGCYDGSLFSRLEGKVGSGIGVDPVLHAPTNGGRFQLVVGSFPEDLPAVEPFDVVTMLAVAEHFTPERLEAVARSCHDVLRPGGRVILTVPSRVVDVILAVLKFVGVLDGMSLEEHHGVRPTAIPPVFERYGFVTLTRKRFQLGANNLFVLRRSVQ